MTLMLNYVGIYLASYSSTRRAARSGSAGRGTSSQHRSRRWRACRLWSRAPACTWGWLSGSLWRSHVADPLDPFGFRLRMIGANPIAAR